MTATAPATGTTATVAVIVGADPGTLPPAAHDIAQAYLAESLTACPRFLTSRHIRRRLPHLTRRTFAQGMRALVAAGLYRSQPTPTGWHVLVTVPTPPRPLRVQAAMTTRPSLDRLTVHVTVDELTPLGLPDVPGLLDLLDVVPDLLTNDGVGDDAAVFDLGPLAQVVPELVGPLAHLIAEGFVVDVVSDDHQVTNAYKASIRAALPPTTPVQVPTWARG